MSDFFIPYSVHLGSQQIYFLCIAESLAHIKKKNKNRLFSYVYIFL